MPGIRKGNDDPLDPPSNMTGWSSNIPDELEE
jgi:hypothetical protein